MIAISLIAQSHPFTNALPYLAGILMVMVSLTALWAICSVATKTIHLLDGFNRLKGEAAANTGHAPAQSPAAATPSASAAPVISGTDDTIAPEIVAVIAAAVAFTVGKTHRIVSIKPMNTSWERAGRQSVLTSHRIR